MTARLAYSYDRDVFALPGRIDDPYSQGCNLLIRENIASQIGDLAELSEKLGLGKVDIHLKDDFRAALESHYSGTAGEDAASIIKVAMIIKGHRGISIDEICGKLGWAYGRVSGIVTTLECDGFVSVDLLQHCSPRVQKT